MKQIFLLFLLLVPYLGIAQDDYYQPKKQPQPAKRTYSIVLKDGTQLRGELIRQDSVEAIIRTANLGEVRLASDQIVRIEQIGAQAEGEGYPNIFSQTMRLAPTAFSAEKNRLYFRNYFLYFSQFEYGITENWSVGTTFFTFLPTALFSLSTKVSIPVSKRVRLGINAQYAGLRDGGLFNGNGSTLLGIGYVQGMVTTGDRQNNTTFGLGWGVSNGELSRNVVGTFGLVRKVSPKLSFITENFVLIGQGSLDFAGVLSAGIRFDRRRHAFDLAAYVPLAIGSGVSTSVLFIPYVSYHIRIGR
ncbi:hypothetical protein [Spirosoma linguale]|uniref:Uncharacterized protein n=1 Tax=Spirosoma linguale (strain ATCC 33905 / DSM 74 / LMG 10896 / Claus 1) TaxID=504472 RepID=D2QPV2_SPILD|nr:hypothetical protein Slin_1638 [Spirosoma linguale DSM 74]